MFSKLKRISTSKYGIHVVVEVSWISFAKKDAIAVGTPINVVYEKKGAIKAGCKFHLIQPQENSEGSIATFNETFTFSATLYKDSSGKFQSKLIDLVIRVKDRDSPIGKAEVNLHDIAESVPTRFRLPVKKNGTLINAFLEVSLTLNPHGEDFIPDDTSSTTSDFAFLKEVVEESPKAAKRISRIKSEMMTPSRPSAIISADDLAALRHNLDKAYVDIENLQYANEDLQKQLQASRSDAKPASPPIIADSEALENERKLWHERESKLQAELEEALQKISHTSDEIQTLQRDLAQERINFEEKKRQFDTDLENAASTSTLLLEELEHAKLSIGDKEVELNSLHEKLKLLDSKEADSQSELNRLRSELNELKNHVESTDVEVQPIAKSELFDELEAERKRVATLSTQLEEMTHQLVAYKESHALGEQKHDQLRSELENQCKAHFSEKAELIAQIEELKSQQPKATLNDSLQQATNELALEKHKAVAMETERSRLSEQLSELSEQLAVARKTIEEQTSQRDLDEKSLLTLLNAIAPEQSLAELNEMTISVLLSALHSKIFALIAKCDQKDSSLSEAKQEAEDYKRAFEARLQSATAEFKKLEEALTINLRNLETKLAAEQQNYQVELMQKREEIENLQLVRSSQECRFAELETRCQQSDELIRSLKDDNRLLKINLEETEGQILQSINFLRTHAFAGEAEEQPLLSLVEHALKKSSADARSEAAALRRNFDDLQRKYDAVLAEITLLEGLLAQQTAGELPTEQQRHDLPNSPSSTSFPESIPKDDEELRGGEEWDMVTPIGQSPPVLVSPVVNNSGEENSRTLDERERDDSPFHTVASADENAKLLIEQLQQQLASVQREGEAFQQQSDEERMKSNALKACLFKFADKLSEEDHELLYEVGIILRFG